MNSIAVVERQCTDGGQALPDFGSPHRISSATRMVGLSSAAVATLAPLSYAVIQPVTVRSLTAPPAEWHGMAAYTASFNPVSLSWLYPAFLVAVAFVIVVTTIQYSMPEDRQLWTLLSFVFASLYTTVFTLNYAIQLLAVAPSIQAGDTDGLSFFAFTNPRGVFAALESIGYVFMILALLLAAPAFRARALERWIRGTFVATFAVPMLLAVVSAVHGVGIQVIGILTTTAWEVLFAVACHGAGRGILPARTVPELTGGQRAC
jgi:hypothetical protein